MPGFCNSRAQARSRRQAPWCCRRAGRRPRALHATRRPLSWGLHFDLTSPFVEGDFAGQKLSALMARAEAGLLDRAPIAAGGRPAAVALRSRQGSPAGFRGRPSARSPAPSHPRGFAGGVGRPLWAREGAHRLRICVARRWRGAKAAIIGRTGANRLASAGPRARPSGKLGFRRRLRFRRRCRSASALAQPGRVACGDPCRSSCVTSR